MAATSLIFLTPEISFSRDEIGNVAAVNPSMFGSANPSDRQTLTLGAGLIRDQRVETTAKGSGQLLFLDQTSLTLAPNSDLVLDHYVYDPERQVGDAALVLSKGVMRFIGGRISKSQDVTVQTPTATIGIRGAIVLLVVEESGRSRVCHLAGEYTVVSAKQEGGVTLSRPNACAIVTQGSVKYQGLITSEELEEIYDELEGNGTGGERAGVSLVDVSGIEKINSGEKAGEENEPVSTSGHSSPGNRTNDGENQFIRDEEEPTVTGPSEPTPPVNFFSIPQPETPVEAPPIAAFSTGLTGSTFDLSTGEFTTFDDVLQGSLIGIGADGFELRIPVPGTSVDGQNDAAAIRGIPGFSSSLEFFEFGFGDVERDPVLGTVTAGSFSSALGDIAGAGVVDPSEAFTYVEFVGQDPQQSELNVGFALFGNATPGQGQFFDDTTRVGSFSDADLAGSQTPTAQGTVNTVEAFVIQPSLAIDAAATPGGADGNFSAPLGDATPLFLVGSEGVARFSDQPSSDAGTAPASGKWLNTVLTLTGDGSAQQSTFLVLADDVKSFSTGTGQTSGPVLASSYLGTTHQFGNTGTGQDVASISYNVGNFEDADLNTLFGQTNRYMVLSSLHRPGLANGSVSPNDPVFEAGAVLAHRHLANGQVDGTQNGFIVENVSADPFANLAASDPGLSERIADPLSLAGARAGHSDTGQATSQLSHGFATGIARCETGLCGDNGFTSQDYTGLYGVRSPNPDSVVFDFGSGTPVGNEVTASFLLKSFDTGAVEGVFDGQEALTNLEFSAGGSTSAVLDDNRFALVGRDTAATIGPQTTSADIAIASFGLTGADGLQFPAETKTQHEYLRWGFWSATYDLQHDTSAGADGTGLANRTDTVHLGTWVAGVAPNAADLIPTSVVAAYEGLAVATHADLATGDTRIIGGSFALEFDFAARTGEVTLNLPDAGLLQTIDVRSQFDPASYQGFANDGLNGTLVNGAFLANPVPDLQTGQTDGIAATAGQFDSVNRTQGTRTIGVFGGDRTRLQPVNPAPNS